jgi:hypothetical protein
MTDLTSARWSPSLLFKWPAPDIRSAHVLSGLTTFIALLIFFSVLTATLLWPWLAHSHAALIGPPEDNMNDFWNTWYAAVAADPAHFFSTRLLRFPEGTPLIYQSFAYPQVFTVVALSRVFGTDLPTLLTLQNLTILASFPLSGVGAFYLVRHMARSTVGGLIGGFVFAFNPSHIAQAAHHAGVASIEFLPFFALAYLLALERRSVTWLAAATISFALSALATMAGRVAGLFWRPCSAFCLLLRFSCPLSRRWRWRHTRQFTAEAAIRASQISWRTSLFRRNTCCLPFRMACTPGFRVTRGKRRPTSASSILPC